MPHPGRLVLLGHPVSHSLSPRIQNAALEAARISARYEALDVEPAALEQTIAALVSERAAGNVTIPFKERVFRACDIVAPLAERIGAVNTWWVDGDGALHGDNTDVGGFDRAARAVMGLRDAPRDLTVGVLGAGGAAAAVLAAVESWPGCIAHVYNRTPERAITLCARFGSAAQPVDDVGAVVGADLIVNATSIGLDGQSMPVEADLLRHDAAVLDLVYKPGDTAFVRAVRARGIRAADGITMLVEQAALAFTRWFGVEPDRSRMWSALETS